MSAYNWHRKTRPGWRHYENVNHISVYSFGMTKKELEKRKAKPRTIHEKQASANRRRNSITLAHVSILDNKEE